MKLTLSVIKADIGGFVGHSSVHKDVVEKVKEVAEDGKDKGIIRDIFILVCGDDIALVMTHTKGVDSSEIHELAWSAFKEGTEVAKKLKMYGAGQDLLADAFSGNIKGMGPVIKTIFEGFSYIKDIQNTKMIQKNKSQKIFIVHGRDEGMKQTVARTLEKLGLEIIILHEQPNEGRTIIEKIEDYSDVSYAIVLLSPDDLAYSKDSSPAQAKYRARQNVIFELGFFIGKLGRKHVCALYKEVENFEIPTDYEGVIYIPYDKGGGWKLKLANELKACGFDIDVNKLIKNKKIK